MTFEYSWNLDSLCFRELQVFFFKCLISRAHTIKSNNPWSTGIIPTFAGYFSLFSRLSAIKAQPSFSHILSAVNSAFQPGKLNDFHARSRCQGLTRAVWLEEKIFTEWKLAFQFPTTAWIVRNYAVSRFKIWQWKSAKNESTFPIPKRQSCTNLFWVKIHLLKKWKYSFDFKV